MNNFIFEDNYYQNLSRFGSVFPNFQIFKNKLNEIAIFEIIQDDFEIIYNRMYNQWKGYFFRWIEEPSIVNEVSDYVNMIIKTRKIIEEIRANSIEEFGNISITTNTNINNVLNSSGINIEKQKFDDSQVKVQNLNYNELYQYILQSPNRDKLLLDMIRDMRYMFMNIYDNEGLEGDNR